MDKYELQKRLKTFALNATKLTKELPKDTLGRYVENQLVRSAFSAAANYRAACIAQSRAAFRAKLSIAFEEIDEAAFWFEVVKDAGLMNSDATGHLSQEAVELSKILGAARKNT